MKCHVFNLVNLLGNFFNVPYLFWLTTDLRKAKVYAGLIEGQKVDLIHALSSLNESGRGSLSFSVKSGKLSRNNSDPAYTVLSFQKLQHLVEYPAYSRCSVNFYWMNKFSETKKKILWMKNIMKDKSKL